MRLLLRGMLLAIVAALTTEGLRAQTLAQDLLNFQNDTDQYNLIAFDSATFNGSSDTQGGIAVQTSLTFAGDWSIASATTPGSNPSLFFSGSALSVTGETKVLTNGTISAESLSRSTWTWTGSSPPTGENANTLYTGSYSSGNQIYASGSTNPFTTAGPSGWSWSSESSKLQSISSALANATATGTIGVSGGSLVFTPPAGTTSGSVVVFNLNASLLTDNGTEYNGQAFSSLSFDVPSGVNYVINVCDLSSGETLFGSGVNFNSFTNDDQVLWNIEGDQTVTIGGSGSTFYGSILAPESTITDNATINGQVVADNYTNPGTELHDIGFEAVSALVPETSTFAMWAVGLCGAVVLMRRRLFLIRKHP